MNIDVVTSGEHAGSSESPTVYPAPDTDAFVDRDGLRVVTLEKLVLKESRLERDLED